MADYLGLAGLKAALGSNVSSTNPGLYQQLTDRVADFITGDDTVGQQALDDAGALIDSYLAPRYTLPITVAADLAALKVIHRKLTIAELYEQHPKWINGEDIPPVITEAKGQALEWLERLASGEAVLPSLADAATMEYGGWTPKFTETATELM